MATTECSVQRSVERGVREVPVTPLTVPVSVYRNGNYQCAKQSRTILQVIVRSNYPFSYISNLQVRSGSITIAEP